MWRKLRELVNAAGGNVSLVFGLCALPLTFIACAAIDLYGVSNERALLQNAVDAGALAGAGHLSVASSSRTDNVTAAAIAVAQQVLNDAHVSSAVVFDVVLEKNNQAVTVTAHADHKALIGFDGFGNASLNVKATAESLNASPLCILQTGGGGGIDVKNAARIRATGCAVHANENITVDGGAMIQADRTQAVGTVKGPVSPAGNSGAMAIDDPFASMNLKAPTDCVGKPEDIKVKDAGTFVLAPGVHCEHFKIEKLATLELLPGEHYFMDDLEAHDAAIIRGDDVVLIFGSTKKINFADKATVELGAQKPDPSPAS